MNLHELGAVEAQRLMASGEVQPVEFLEAVERRIAETEPAVQAWETLDLEGARSAARALGRRGERAGALFGLPIGVKDVIDVAGLPTKAAYRPYEDAIAPEDASVVRFAREAGAVILGKTVATQFAWSQDPPKTRNPWNLEHTPGASSSGSPAAVAAGQVPLAIGTQTTSSLLRPAAYCGVVGLKPTYGLVSCHGIIPTSWSSDHPAFVARSVADIALLLGVVARYDPADPHSAAPVAGWDLATAERAADHAPVLGRVREFYERAEPSVRDRSDASLASLERAGAEVIDVSLPIAFELIQAIHWTVHNSESAAIHYEQFSQNAPEYLNTVRRNVEVGELIPAPLYVHARRLKNRFLPEMVALAGRVDALVCPTSSDTPPRIDVGNVPHRLGDPSFQVPWTCFGFPNVSVPTGLDENGLPAGLQLVTGPFEEGALLHAAAWCETVFGSLGEPVGLNLGGSPETTPAIA